MFINAYSKLNMFWAYWCPKHVEIWIRFPAPHDQNQQYQANTTCSPKQSRSSSPDDGHNDARNILWLNKRQKNIITCDILLILFIVQLGYVWYVFLAYYAWPLYSSTKVATPADVQHSVALTSDVTHSPCTPPALHAASSANVQHDWRADYLPLLLSCALSSCC
jgi:hypothetical protein